MKLGAVIVTYNSADTIDASLRSLQKNGIQEIVVVDNASSDTTVAQCKQHEVRIIQQKENKGFASAVNTGLQHTSSPYVLIFNPDAEIHDGSLTEAIFFLDNHKDVSILGLLLVDSHDVPEPNGYGRPVGLVSLISRHVVSSSPPIAPTEVGWVSGGAMIVRVIDVKEINGFDDSFFLYWEDVDLCRRVWEAGKEVFLFPSIRVRHIRGVSSTDISQKTSIYDASADRYFRKHYSQLIWKLQRILRRLYRLVRSQAL